MSRRPEGYWDDEEPRANRLIAGLCGASVACLGLVATAASLRMGIEAELAYQQPPIIIEGAAEASQVMAGIGGAMGVSATIAGLHWMLAARR